MSRFHQNLESALLLAEKALGYRSRDGQVFGDNTPYDLIYNYAMDNGGVDRFDANAMINSVENDLRKSRGLVTQLDEAISKHLRMARRDRSDSVHGLSAAHDAVNLLDKELQSILMELITVRRSLSRSRRTGSARNVLFRAVDSIVGLTSKLPNALEVLEVDDEQFGVVAELFDLVGGYLEEAAKTLKDVLHNLNDKSLT